MNWTGGSLPRSRRSNAKATLTNAQKKHFAKVRGRLLGVRPSSPNFDTTIFKDAGNRHEYPQHRRSHQAFPPNHGSQTRLDDFENVAPVVRKLESLRSRVCHDQSGSRASNECTRPDVRAKTFPYTRADHESLNWSYEGAIEQSFDTEAPILRSNTSTTADQFEAKRQELLHRSDWVGLANTKPVNIQFSSAKDRELIGKRRRLDTRDQDVPRALVSKRQRLDLDVLDSHKPFRLYKRPSPSIGDISIRIGEQEHETDIHCDSPVNVAKQHSLSGTPDEMLLDRELYVQGAVHSHELEPKSRQLPAVTESSSISARRSHINGKATPAPLQASWTRQSSWVDSEDMKVHTKQEPNIRVRGKQLRKESLIKHSPTLVDQPWASVPGLPLVFSGDSQEPIEISSAEGSVDGSIYSRSATHELEEAFSAGQKQNITMQIANIDAWGLGNHINEDPSKELGRQLPSSGAQLYRSLPAQDSTVRGQFQRDRNLECEEQPSARPVTRLAVTNSKLEKMFTTDPAKNKSPGITKDPDAAATSRTTPNTAALSPNPPRSPTPANEELIWRRFVFGSEDVDRDWTLDNEITELPQFESHSSRINSRSPGVASPNKSSLLAEASSNAEPVTVAPNRPYSPNHLSVLAQPSTTRSVHPPNSTSPSHPTLSSLPSNPLDPNLQVQTQSKFSLQVQASGSTSPSRTQRTLLSLSSDELAATPARPTFVFRKPTKYISSNADVVGTIHLGLAEKSKKKKRRGRQPARDVEIWQDDEGHEQGEDDEIEDELAWKLKKEHQFWKVRPPRRG